MAANVDEAIRALGDPTRRAIFELIAVGPYARRRHSGAAAG